MIPPVKGFLKSTLIDWEGKIASVVFLPGCNFRCGYCHSPHLVSNADQFESIPLDAILESIKAEGDWLDGVVVTGGEPTIHPGLPELIETLRRNDLAVKLDTNGASPGLLRELIRAGMVDAVAMDVKAPLMAGRYETVTGVSCDLEAVRECIAILLEGAIDYEFRTTVCPTYLELSDIAVIASQIASARRYVLQNFRPTLCLDKGLEATRPYTIEDLKEMADAARRHVATCCVRGVYDSTPEPSAADAR